VADPFGRLKAAIKSDLYAIRDRDARIRAAVKVLEEAGFEVFLERATARRKGPKPNLRIVTDKDEDPSSA
jgi:hypothetical protein